MHMIELASDSDSATVNVSGLKVPIFQLTYNAHTIYCEISIKLVQIAH